MLNQLTNLTEQVDGNDAFVNHWLTARKHLLIAYYNVVGIKLGKEKHMVLDECALDEFCSTWWIISSQAILIFMSVLLRK